MSAAYYARTSKADGTYDHDMWLQYDGGHVRCKNRVKSMHRASDGWYSLCGMHSNVAKRTGQFFPYFPPGRECHQPCCAETWDVSVWTPSKRLSGDAKDEGLRDLYQRAANNTLLVLDPEDLGD